MIADTSGYLASLVAAKTIFSWFLRVSVFLFFLCGRLCGLNVAVTVEWASFLLVGINCVGTCHVYNANVLQTSN